MAHFEVNYIQLYSPLTLDTIVTVLYYSTARMSL